MRRLLVVALAIGCNPGERNEPPGADAPTTELAPCDPARLGTSYIGCEYYPTVIGTNVGTDFDYAIAISNTTDRAATVDITGGALGAPLQIQVAPFAVHVQTLPWQADLKLCMSPMTDGCTPAQGALARGGAYRVRSDQPVTVYQFSPLQFKKNGVFSFTNDASLLIPTNAWRTSYYVAAWPDFGRNGSELAIVAAQDGTEVTLTARAAAPAAGGAPAFEIGVPKTVTLNAGDVLELTSAAQSGDFTGSHISSTKPVQVIAGHYCATVPEPISACDHLEEVMFPAEALGTRYVINAPAVPSMPDGKVHYVRVVATAPNTTLVYDPPQANAPTTIARAGDFIEIANTATSFAITASEPVLVAQYMEGYQAGGMTGDPSMTLAVPVEQFRATYSFHSPLSYETNYVDVTAPVGAMIHLDGALLTLVPIGNTGFALARVPALGGGPAGDGNHTITGNVGFGISVYGYGAFTSYWYPGGLELNQLLL